MHGRSFQDAKGHVFNFEQLVDEFGHNYEAVSMKGIDTSRAAAQIYSVEPNGIRVLGCMDASTYSRCSQASRIMREAGILTEFPFYYARPKLFIDPFHPEIRTTLRSFKRDLYDNYVTEQIEQNRRCTSSYNDAGNIKYKRGAKLDDAYFVGDALDEMQFGVMYRGMLSNLRLNELFYIGDSETIEHHINLAIRALQKRKPTNFECWNDIEGLNPDLQVDRRFYLISTLPKLMAENLARFHEIGGYHKYLHAGNWTLCGEIVDLDSVRHAFIEEEDLKYTTLANAFNDFMWTVSSIADSLQDVGTPEGNISQAVKLFTDNYCKARNFEGRQAEIPELLSEMVVGQFTFVDTHCLPKFVTLPVDFVTDLQERAGFYLSERDREEEAGNYLLIDRDIGFHKREKQYIEPIVLELLKEQMEEEMGCLNTIEEGTLAKIARYESQRLCYSIMYNLEISDICMFTKRDFSELILSGF